MHLAITGDDAISPDETLLLIEQLRQVAYRPVDGSRIEATLGPGRVLKVW